jgi:hypothetical protein
MSKLIRLLIQLLLTFLSHHKTSLVIHSLQTLLMFRLDLLLVALLVILPSLLELLLPLNRLEIVLLMGIDPASLPPQINWTLSKACTIVSHLIRQSQKNVIPTLPPLNLL